MGITKDSMSFEFMLKEYEKLHGFFDLHYQAVEKTTNFYFIFVGAIASVNGLIYKTGSLKIFALAPVQLLLVGIISALGAIIYFRVIEHRILIIAYVKSLNLNRKWFVDHAEDTELENYLYWKTGVKTPKFYERYRHFYWEAFGLSLLNSIFLSLFVINVVIHLFHFKSIHALDCNVLAVFGITAGFTLLQLEYYRRRGLSNERKVEERFS